jgi:hypothetical protein
MSDPSGISDFVLGCLLAAAAPAVVFAVVKAPKSGEPMAVVMPIHMSEDEVLASLTKADARLIRMSAKNIAIIDGHAGVTRRLYAGGAWFVGNAEQQGFCAPGGE